MQDKMVTATIGALTLIAMLAPSWAGAQQPQQQQQRPPQQRQQQPQQQSQQGGNASQIIEDFILVRLSEQAWVGGDFKVHAQQGVVTLSGTVPSERAKSRALGIARSTLGVQEVKDEMRVVPASATAAPAAGDTELSRRVAQQIANAIPGAKTGEDWWLTGWRVEGDEGGWSFTVEADDGQVFLEGDVPRLEIMRQAVDAARQTEGVMSVRSDFDLDRVYARYPYGPYGYYGYPGYGYPYAHPHLDPHFFVYDAETPAGRAQAVSTLTGEVTSIDRQNGTATLKTDTGSFKLNLPASTLQDLEQGEQVTLQIGVQPTSPAASPPLDGSSQQNQGKQ